MALFRGEPIEQRRRRFFMPVGHVTGLIGLVEIWLCTLL